MPDQSSAADEHALLQEITAPLSALPDDAVQVAADVEFPIAFRGYDRLAVDAYIKKTSQLVAELQSTRSPDAAVRRALERVGEQISGILQRAHETAEQITMQSRREAEDRLVRARQEATQIAAAGEQRVKDLDAETDRIWAERLRIVEDARELAAQLLALADEAAARFPPDETTGESTPGRPAPALFDAEVEEDDEPDEGGVDRSRVASADEPAASTYEPAADAETPAPAPVSGPPPPAPGAPGPVPEPEDEPEDLDPTTVLPRTEVREHAPDDRSEPPPTGVPADRSESPPTGVPADRSESPPTTRLPRTDEHPPPSEHPPPAPPPPDPPHRAE